MLPHSEEQKRFNRSLETGKPYRTTFLGNEYPISAQALGKMSSAQFTMLIRPGDYSSSWLDMDVPRPRIPGQPEQQPFDAEHPEYQKLEQQIMKEGVLRPVIVGDKRDMMIPDFGEKWPNRTLARPVLDGHHRAFFAIKHGIDIPVSVLRKHHY